MSTNKHSLFAGSDGKSLKFTFWIVSSLFLLWGFCNGMIDVMDKHFQDELNLTKSQSANVQFAHYLGYFLMALPAGWLAKRFGWKGGIIAGLLLVAVGGFWFLPATSIQAAAHAGTVSANTAFIAYLIGVCAIAAGLTFLETVANPYTTVLGPPRYAATRINLAQSCNGVGWILGPIVGATFFYSKEPKIYFPYVITAILVLVLAVVFKFSYVPDIKNEDDYHLDEAKHDISHSLLTRWHFLLAVAAQFLYVAAQAGIFSFFINCMTSDKVTGFTMVPQIPAAWHTDATKGLIEVKTSFAAQDIKDMSAFINRLQRKSDALSCFLATNLSKASIAALAEYKGEVPVPTSIQSGLLQDLSNIVRKRAVYDPVRFAGVSLQDDTRQLLAKNPAEDSEDLARLNRYALRDAFSGELSYRDGIIGISDKGAATLASVAFICFLLGRISGAMLLKKFSAHKILGLYGALNVGACLLIFFNLGWVSAAGVFLSYFFMSIMFPTIFALGIFGLGAKTKTASAYLVMAIMGGAILPKFMGHVADEYDMCRSFIVPMACFAFIALYGFLWPKFSNADSLHGVGATGGH
jgi:fucose permease